MIDDSTLGRSVLIVFGLLYLYYTFWIYALPFVDDDNFVLRFFPPVKYALLVPAVLGTIFIGTLVTFIVVTFLLSWQSIMENNWIVIGIGGASCSGKTTITNELLNKFSESEKIHQDDYYYPVGSPNLEYIEEIKHYNWDTLSAIDMDRMVEAIKDKLR